MSRNRKSQFREPIPAATPAAPVQEARKKRVAIVQLARHGDIVNILPVALELSKTGHDVTLITNRKFASILEPASYVTPKIVDGLDNTPEEVAQAASGEYDQVICAQVNGNSHKPEVDCESFIAKNWANVGKEWVERFHDLPLIFDSRDAAGEAQAIADHVPEDDGRPLLAYCLEGYSSPFADREAFEEWLVNKHRARYRLLNIGGLKLPKVHHLIGIIEKADVLLTVDSLPLHLAYATGTPTIALSRGIPHYNSEPRNHWIARQFYPVANAGEGRQAIYDVLAMPLEKIRSLRGSLCRKPKGMYRNRIIHAVDWYITPTASDDRRRILNARKTWDRLHNGDVMGENRADWNIAFHELKHGQRSSKDLGDNRKLPYIKDIIDRAADGAKDEDIIAFTNADTIILEEAPGAIREKLAEGDCCYSRRIDVSDGSYPYTREQLSKYPRHCGADLFAFRASWWRAHRDEFPDLLLACEGWDWVARRVLERHSPTAEIDPPVIAHERHSPLWAYSVNIHDNPGQKWNRAACSIWARENGFADAIYTDGTPYLFKPDEALAKR